VADGINLRLGRRDMNVFRTIDRAGERPVVHVAGRHPAALCPSCAHPSVDTNGTGWRDVIDVIRTLVITLSVCVRRFVCTNDACPQRTFDERFEGIGWGGASERALAFFADLARGRATAAVARDLGVPDHYLRLAVGRARDQATAQTTTRTSATCYASLSGAVHLSRLSRSVRVACLADAASKHASPNYRVHDNGERLFTGATWVGDVKRSGSICISNRVILNIRDSNPILAETVPQWHILHYIEADL
jgi:hypothetical protein